MYQKRKSIATSNLAINFLWKIIIGSAVSLKG